MMRVLLIVAAAALISVAEAGAQESCLFGDCKTPSLVVTPFAQNAAAAPGNTHVLRSGPPPYKESVAFQSAASLVTVLTSSTKAEGPITVSRVSLELVDFSDKEFPELNYDFGPSNLTGKGIAEKLAYHVDLDGKVMRIARLMPAGQIPVDAKDLLPTQQIDLYGDAQSIKLELTPLTDGLYTLHLQFTWAFGGASHTQESQTVYLYRNED